MTYQEFKNSIIAQLDDEIKAEDLTDDQRGKLVRLRARILIDLL